ncbi:hypothetical protein GOBAR_DD32661 [Gossypium barbadense]|nr:hypothetical protein GOBAR_DD32661 [Gossypium barbadense]
MTVPVSFNENPRDGICWKHTHDDSFSISNAYEGIVTLLEVGGHCFMTITLTCHLLAVIRWNGCSLIFCRNIGLPVLNSHAINSSIHIRYPPSSIAVKWQPPSIGWKKLNTDGSAIGNPGKAGAGALIRDHDYIWVKGCYRFIPKENNIEVELMLWTIIPNTRVKHVFREGNRSVDALANLESRSFCNQPHEAICRLF